MTNTCAIAERFDELWRHQAFAGIIIIRQAQHSKYNTSYRLQFNTCNIIFQPSSIGKSIHSARMNGAPVL